MAKKQFKAESKRLLDLMIHSIYTHQEIFLREIISNASDAMDKLAYTALTDDKVSVNREELKITLTRNEQEGILTVSDRGIGMTREELEENLGTICKSGSLGFKQNMEQTEDIDIIGQFGVGFYAAFMVSDNVTVISRKYGEDAAWKWTSNGGDGYTVTEAQRAYPGTDIIMTLKKDTEDEQYSRFLKEWELRSLVKKYSDYIRYPICMQVQKSRRKEGSSDEQPEYESYTEMETLNSMVPIWQRNKKDVTAEEYNTFYREKFMDYSEPARVISFSAEGNVSFKALLYIPSKAPFDYYSKDYKRGLQLYSSGVMIMDACEDLLPEHFSFVRGVVDSQDLSLNISRELLQHDRQLKIIARGIEKKIKAELTAMLENDREKYSDFFAAFGRQLKYGAVAQYGAHKDATQDLLLFYSNNAQKLITLKEYTDAMAEGQEKIYYLAGESVDRLAKLPQGRTLKEKGYDVLLLTDEVDEFVPQTLMTYSEKSFCNAATEDLGLQTEEEKEKLKEQTEKKQSLLTFVKDNLGDDVTQVRLVTNATSAPVCLVPASGMSFEMEKYMKRMNPEFNMPAMRILELNPEHPAVQALEVAVATDTEKAKDYVTLLYNQALLLADLPISDPAAYTELVCKFMK